MTAEMCICVEDPVNQIVLKELVMAEECLVMSILMWSEARLPFARVVQYTAEYRDAFIRLRDICPNAVEFFPAVESMLLEGEDS